MGVEVATSVAGAGKGVSVGTTVLVAVGSDVWVAVGMGVQVAGSEVAVTAVSSTALRVVSKGSAGRQANKYSPQTKVIIQCNRFIVVFSYRVATSKIGEEGRVSWIFALR
jgi:hypothetical protein